MQPHVSSAMIDFLVGIHQHNELPWMHEHKKLYQAAKSDFEAMVFFIIQGIQEFDATIQDVTPKDCMFRINRDIRFAKDKRPYKEHFGAFITPNGKKWEGAGYYVHIEPTAESFIAAGNYHYEKNIVQNFRDKLIESPKEFITIQKNIEKSAEFGGLEGERLKRVPNMYSKDHPQAELLTYKSYAYRHVLTKKEVQSADIVSRAVQLFKKLHPFVLYINSCNH